MAVYSTIQVGDKQPNPFLGFDFYAPTNGNIGANPNSWSFGDSSNYVSPFVSWSQQIVNATNDLGPYARKQNGISGRLIISTMSPTLGELGFVQQCWYGFDDTPYNTDNGTATGNRFSSKAEWWDKEVIKTKVCVNDLMTEGHPSILVDVAVGVVDKLDQDFWQPDLTVDNIFKKIGNLLSGGSENIGPCGQIIE
jgi:hypothetical protein